MPGKNNPGYTGTLSIDTAQSSFQGNHRNDHNYSNEELNEYRAVFELFDKDGSGSIGVEELGEAMRQMDMAATDKELNDLIHEIDEDGNGEIDFDEFCSCMKRMSNKKESHEEIINQCFRVFDQDMNGFVTESEFKRIFVQIGEFNDTMADLVFREVDIDGNGQVDFDEFAQMVRTYLLEDDNNSIGSDDSVEAVHITRVGRGEDTKVYIE